MAPSYNFFSVYKYLLCGQPKCNEKLELFICFMLHNRIVLHIDIVIIVNKQYVRREPAWRKYTMTL